MDHDDDIGALCDVHPFAPGGLADSLLPPPPAAAVEPAAAPQGERRHFERGDHKELAVWLLDHLRANGHEPIADASAGTVQIHVYDEERGVWRAVPDDEQSRIVQLTAGMPVGSREKPRPLRIGARDVAGASVLARDVAAEGKAGFFNHAPHGTAFANGFVVVRAGVVELFPHSPDNRAIDRMAFDYSDSEPPFRFLDFLRDVFRDDADRHEKTIFLREFLGACFLGLAPRYDRAVIAFGDGDNGKSVLIDIASALFPGRMRAAIPPQKWEDDYHRALLAGVRLNALSELPEQDILASESFKAIVTGDEITGRVIYGRPFAFRPRAGHLFAANALPATADLSKGFWRRLVVITFSRTFTVDERIVGLAQSIIDQELPAIVAWVLGGAADLLARGYYLLPPSSTEAVEEWRRSADKVGLFFESATQPVANHVLNNKAFWTKAKIVFSAYQRWSSSQGFRSVSVQKFAQRAKSLGIPPEHTEYGSVYPVTVNTGE